MQQKHLRILVTGGAGYIGKDVTKALMKKGCTVTVLDNFSTGKPSNLKGLNGFKLISADIRDIKSIETSMKDIDICLHLAAVGNVEASIETPREYFSVNALGTLNILEQARKNDIPVIFTSTGMVYDTKDKGLIDETHPLKSSSPYVASKISAENFCMAYYQTYSLPVTVLRPFHIYGPGVPTYTSVIHRFISAKLDGNNLTVYGDGTQKRDFTYMTDCIDFMLKATFAKKNEGEIINFGTGNDVSINELALMILADKSRMTYVKHHHPQCEVQRLACDYRKAKKLLGWEPHVKLEDGIKRLEEWMKLKSN